MAGIALEEIPDPARAAWRALRDELRATLGEDLFAMWGYGGSASVHDPPHGGDLDTHVLVAHRPDEAMVRALEDVTGAIERDHGVELDTWFVLADDVRRADAPHHAWLDGRRDTSWALHRAHWLAGRYVNLHGPEPATLVRPPSWDELEPELSRELEHIERHVYEGDTDGYEATYAILNGSRILHAVETHVVAVSKREAGTWALEHLPDRWHSAVQAALRSYERRATAEDLKLLALEMAPFVAFVRQSLPGPEDRPADAPPRWSGY